MEKKIGVNWLLKKALSIMSAECGIKLELDVFGSGHCCILTEDHEVVRVSRGSITTNGIAAIYLGSQMYFESAKACLEMLMVPGSYIGFHSNGIEDEIKLPFSSKFGTSLEEICINCDLLKSKVNKSKKI